MCFIFFLMFAPESELSFLHVFVKYICSTEKEAVSNKLLCFSFFIAA